MRQPIPVDVGISLRPEHHALVLARRPAVAWFEVQAGTLLSHGDGLRDVECIARDYPLSVQAAGLSLGSVTRPDAAYLGQLRAWVTRLQPDFVSDHLSWSAVDDMPYTEEALVGVVRNVTCVQDILQRQILLENTSNTLTLPDAALAEEAFLAEVVLRTGCGIVLDVRTRTHYSPTFSRRSSRKVSPKFSWPGAVSHGANAAAHTSVTPSGSCLRRPSPRSVRSRRCWSGIPKLPVSICCRPRPQRRGQRFYEARGRPTCTPVPVCTSHVLQI
jgi:hypothetical protein